MHSKRLKFFFCFVFLIGCENVLIFFFFSVSFLFFPFFCFYVWRAP